MAAEFPTGPTRSSRRPPPRLALWFSHLVRGDQVGSPRARRDRGRLLGGPQPRLDHDARLRHLLVPQARAPRRTRTCAPTSTAPGRTIYLEEEEEEELRSIAKTDVPPGTPPLPPPTTPAAGRPAPPPPPRGPAPAPSPAAPALRPGGAGRVGATGERAAVATRDEAPGTDPGASRPAASARSRSARRRPRPTTRCSSTSNAGCANPSTDRFALCRDLLWQLYEGRPYDAAVLADRKLAVGVRARLGEHDPHNATLEPEYYYDCDPDRYQPRGKPLIWLWDDVRRLAARPADPRPRLPTSPPARAVRLQARGAGTSRCSRGLEITFGYNLEVGDDVIVHREVLLDDRGGIRIGDPASRSATTRTSTRHEASDRTNIHDITSPADGDRGRRTHHVPRDGARRHARGRADAMVGALGARDEGRPSPRRGRRHPRQADPRQEAREEGVAAPSPTRL